MWYADFLVNVTGRFDEAIAEARRAVELDPQNSLYQFRLGVTLLNAHRDDDGIAVLQQVLRTDPSRRGAAVQLVHALARKGMDKEAFAMMQQVNANNRALAEALAQAYAEGGFRKALRVRADLMAQQAQRGDVSPAGVAGFYARAGEKALALDWLEKGYEERETAMVGLGSGRGWDSLRGDPRFEALLRRMKLF